MLPAWGYRLITRVCSSDCDEVSQAEVESNAVTEYDKSSMSFSPLEAAPKDGSQRDDRLAEYLYLLNVSEENTLMRKSIAALRLLGICLLGLSLFATWGFAQESQKLVLIAGKPSHPPRMHEFNAGVQLLAKCLDGFPGLDVEVVLNGWPKDEDVFEGADAIVFYMDGGARHEVVLEDGRRMKLVNEWAKAGVGLGFMHFGVEVVADQAGKEFKDWIGGPHPHG